MMRSFDTSLFSDIYGDIQPIAIIGAGCRFVGASDPFSFWRRIADAEELSRRVTAEDLLRAGLDPALLERSDFVAVASVLEEANHFDAEWFGYSRAEAATIDPQQRLFLTCSWEALEMAGLSQGAIGQRIGVFGAARMSTHYLATRENVLEAGLSRTFQRLIGNDKDYLTNRVAYKLGLTGPALTVQTACSSSLVAVHIACEQLRSGECDMALAGGAALTFPMAAGYFHQPGMIFSPDGKCRPFDASAAGTFIGNGVGVVLLKPLRRALEDGDGVLAVIRGSAVNNDGSGKAGFTAPSLTGQRAVIEEALALSDIRPEKIGYVEAHGTATPLGDPIEVQALTAAFRSDGKRTARCALGSLKANTGHLDTAAGVASLLKAAFAVKTGLIPPCLHFQTPNPALDLNSTPFTIPQVLTPWTGEHRVAGVSSFGIGGTNCHVIVEALPAELAPLPSARGNDVVRLALSARDDGSLKALAATHAEALLDGQFEAELDAYCATLLHHRTGMGHRLVIAGRDGLDLARQLRAFADGAEAGRSFVPELAADDNNNATIPGLPADTRARPARRTFAPVSILKGERQVEGEEDQSGWKTLTRRMQAASEQRAAEHDWSPLPIEAVATAELHAIYVGNAFQALGVFTAGDRLTIDEVMDRGGIEAAYQQLTARLLRDLVNEGVLQRDDDRYGNLVVKPLDDAEPILRDMARRGYQRLTGMADRVGPRLAEMLRKEIDAVSLVFPSAAMDDVEEMYERQRDSIFLNNLARDAVQALIEGLPGEHHIRVMQIGAGTGGTTSAVLPALPADRTTYTYTDVGPLFLRKAQAKFAHYPFLHYSLYDIERDPVEQGYKEGGYDLIIAANVLHNGSDLKGVLQRARRLLAPGGLLLMREISTPKPLFDFIFGPLVPVLSDVAERDGELFPPLPRWGEFLIGSGFSAWAAFPTANQQPAAIGENIILARNADIGQAAKSLALAGAGIVTADLAGLIDALVKRSGKGFWRHENVSFHPRSSAGEVVWNEDRGTLTLTDSAGSVPFLSVKLASQEIATPPPRVDASGMLFDGEVCSVLAAALGGEVQGKTFTAASISATSAVPSSGRWTVGEGDSGLDITIADDDGWPCLWIKRLQLAKAVDPRARLYHWAWQSIDGFPAGQRAVTVVRPEGASSITPSQTAQVAPDWQIPAEIAAGNPCILDLTDPGIAATAETFARIAEIISSAAARDCKLDVVTRAVLSAVPWDRPQSAALAGLRGLLRVARREYPAFCLRWIDIDDSGSVERLPYNTDREEDILAVRRGRVFAPRLQPLQNTAALSDIPVNGLHILTGGLSSLALLAAEWLVSKGVATIWIVARRKPEAEERERLAALESLGTKVRIWDDVDLSERISLERVLKAAAKESEPVSSIFHFAGHLEDARMDDLDAEQIERVFAPKIAAAQTLIEWLPRLKPDHLIFASSAASVFGPPGQAAHAAANAALEGLAEQARIAGWSVKALAWGYWDDSRAVPAGLARIFADQGMLNMTPEEGLALLSESISQKEAVLVPAKVDWHRLSAAVEGRLPRSFAACAPSNAPFKLETPSSGSAETWLRSRLAALLGIAADAIDPDDNLVRLGLDSLMMLELNQALEGEFGLKVSSGLSLGNDTLRKLADHVTGATGDPSSTSASDVMTVVRNHVAAVLSVAVDEVRPDRKLVELGLDSLLFLDLSERVAKDFGIRLSGETAMQFDTVGVLVAAINAQLSEKATPASAVRAALQSVAQARPELLLGNGDLRPRDMAAHETAPLSALQRIWWRGRAKERPLGGTARHLYVEYDKTTSGFDLDAFEKAWNRFVERHVALRMTIDGDGRALPCRTVSPYRMPRDDYRWLDAGEVERRLASVRERMSQQMFDLSLWPHFEWRISLLPQNGIRLHFDTDTTLIDIESFQVMLREMGRHMSQPDRPLPPISFSATDYMRGMDLIASTSAAAEDRRQIAERGRSLTEPPNLPLLTVPEMGSKPRFAITRRTLTRAEWIAARDAALAHGASGTALAVSALAVALLPWTGNVPRFALQLAYCDRKPLHVEAINIACEASAVMPITFDLGEDGTFLEVMQQTEKAIREGLSFELADGLAALAVRAGGEIADTPNLTLPVVFTSLLGVRQSYALPESADPVLGMPTYEYAAQPQVALHFQVLEEERELLYNLDEVAGLFPADLAPSLLAVFADILRAGTNGWSLPVSFWASPAKEATTALRLSQWMETLHG